MKNGFDPLRGYNPHDREMEMYSYTRQLARKSQHCKSEQKLDRWFGDSYKPMMKRNEQPRTNPIVADLSVDYGKVDKHFELPDRFKASVKKAEFSGRDSKIFNEKQTQITWKTTVKPIVLKQSPNMDENEKPHIKLTDYTTKYKRNPITSENCNPQRQKVQKPRQRNPITDGQLRDLMQKKGRATPNITIFLG